jgi:hypothetical protein
MVAPFTEAPLVTRKFVQVLAFWLNIPEKAIIKPSLNNRRMFIVIFK